MTADEVRAIEDPYERARVALEALKVLDEQVDALRDVRDTTFAELHAHQGETLRAIATRYGVSKSMVATAAG